MYNVDFVMIKDQTQLAEQAQYRPIGTVCYTAGGEYAWQLDESRTWVACHAFGFNCSSDTPSAATLWGPNVIALNEAGNNALIKDISENSGTYTISVDVESLLANDDDEKILNLAIGTNVDIHNIKVNGDELTDEQIAASADLPFGYFLYPIDAAAVELSSETVALTAAYCPDLTITIAVSNIDVPGISVELSAALADSAEEAHVGDTITYTAVVANTGETALTGIEISDSVVTLDESAFNLDVEGSKTITYTYEVVEADLTAGAVENTVTVTVSIGEGEDDVLTASDSASVTVVATPDDDTPADDNSGDS